MSGLFLLPLLAAPLLFAAHIQADRLVRPRRTAAPHTPARLGIAHWEDVSFTTGDGLTLRGWFVPPRPDSGGAAVVCAHGTAGHRGHLLAHAAALHAEGYGALLFDLRAHGESDGSVSGVGLHEHRDVLAALEYVRSRPDVDARRVALLGHSMGGAAVLRAAARTPHARAVVSIASAASLAENVASGVRAFTHLPAFPLAPLVVWVAERRTRGRMRDMRPVADAARLRDQPLLLIHGDADRVVGIENGRRLREAHGSAQLLEIAGAGHLGVIGPRHLARYHGAMLGFLRLHLRSGTTAAAAAAGTPTFEHGPPRGAPEQAEQETVHT
ncbi:alpha/beta hydrolase [Deinococcus budaensis]|uniref:Dipeptidyl aminopeptidase/acylaminoacyl peptidase n=1 Tax=Deinococcus budaensis TaxID=1665626 RepID=A0A7W8GFT5_9DEIO|nr:alpha/beta fold hydrolase [Deinococcus budaensis]MBB5234775.1 dipeptidyl aminopeptidase/acylaminoacyl peptidase [Deinococcus budaensis]